MRFELAFILNILGLLLAVCSPVSMTNDLGQLVKPVPQNYHFLPNILSSKIAFGFTIFDHGRPVTR
jgi:hypothetical protein